MFLSNKEKERKCDAFLHEETFVVRDYWDDPVSKSYRRFSGNEKFRICEKCMEVMPAS